MNRVIRISTLVAILVIAGGAVASAQETLTYVDLVKRMLDLERLAQLPADGEKCGQCSSYDRASKYDEATGKYVHWDANGDGDGIIRREGNQIVMAEMDGPGCIWRIWSAKAEKGHVKIYLDGQETPTIDLPFIEYFDGKHAPFTYPELSYQMKDQGSQGENLYFPIPYQKSCKIVADRGWGAYYQFVYTTYPKGTKLPTFTGKLTADEAAALQKVNDFFRNDLGSDPAGKRDGQETIRESLTVRPQQKAKIELKGPRAITAIRGMMSLEGRDDEMVALRKLTLQITFDGQARPAVWCPLGDFFGTAPGVNFYQSLTTGITDQGAYALWYMPFAKSAVLEISSDDATDREVQVEVAHAPLKGSFEGLGYFHCKWHRDVFPLSKDRWPDWVMLRTEGRGRFCGVMLHVWNPRGGWWGEGDEKFFVDGEKFPSTIGTGSEDYFGYAWCNPHLFQHPYHCQTMTENNAGHQSVLRWHITDNIPFQTQFEACIEKYYPNGKPTLYACPPVWYLAPGGNDPFEPLPVEERWGYCTVPPLDGGIKVLGQPRGQVQTQEMSGWGPGKWANDDQLWWTGAKPGDKLNLACSVAKEGKYEVSVTLTKAVDYGIVKFSIDGKAAGQPIDLYHDGVIPTGPVSLGNHDLSKGEHKFTVEIVGANDKAVKGYMFGLDRILLKAAGE